mmetsp:Transcript_5340/g.6622  ORF Transcript_5340/g.6622 Transcript_5340/m.6622 type:complete len:206 (-) Transcript_5340:171-788(-)
MCAVRGVPCSDLIGPTIRELSSHLELQQRKTVTGKGWGLDDSYFKRVEAVEFSMRQDDGNLPKNLARAEVVVVGPSRCGKTPLTMFLAQEHSLMAANVPLVLNIPPPRQLLTKVDSRIVFGLTCQAAALHKIRAQRLTSALGGNQEAKASISDGEADYSSMRYVTNELSSARRLYAKNSWHSIDVTGRAVEDTAGTIVSILNSIE